MQVLITGANRGIGLALAQHYTDAGCKLIATARKPKVGQWPLDVTYPADLGNLVRQVTEPLDLLICNAGVYLDRAEALEGGYDAQIWANTFAVNVAGVFHTVQAFLPHLRRATGGKIALISSSMGSSARALGGSYIYRASKAAVVNLGRNLAADLRRDGIAVGIYHPGWVKTDMGGMAADITPAQSAAGLQVRMAQLSLQNTGCFENYDGAALSY